MILETNLVKEFQQKFDVVGDKPNFINSNLRKDLILEEVYELIKAFEENNHIEVADAYADIIFLCLGGVYLHGVPKFDEIFKEVCLSNLSKADVTYEDALNTIRFYENKGIEAYIDKKSEDCYIIRRLSDNKVLKSTKYKPVQLQKYYE